MSGVKRYYAPGLDCMWRDPTDAPRECIQMVLASDYDKLACLVEAGHKLTMDAACGEIAALEAERDELRAQVEAMRNPVANERTAAFEACPESNCDWGAFYRGWMARAKLQANK